VIGSSIFLTKTKMGKKSKNPKKNTTPTPSPAAEATPAAPAAEAYRSDGPSEEELNTLQTTSTTLQAKLDRLTELASLNDRSGFVHQFVPLDLSSADTLAYLQDLTNAPEADGQWRNLTSEIAAIAAGRGVHKIEGDQKSNAVFFFTHPLFPDCDREVSFICSGGEWRAEG